MPFLTEELWHEIGERKETDCIIVAEWPKADIKDSSIITEASTAIEVITNIRNVRNSKQLAKNLELDLIIKTGSKDLYKRFEPVIKKLAAIKSVTFSNEKPEGSVSFIFKADEFFIPLAGEIDPEKERATILKELEYAKGFLQSVEKKLSNEKFVSGAPPQVIETERKKKADAEAKIKALEQSLTQL
jgi:valyl-tRNA synthetase